MILLRHLLLTLLFLLPAGLASAVPVTLSLDGITVAGGAFPVNQTIFPAAPITGAVGSSDINFGAGTGTLTLPNYFVIIDVNQDLSNDANLQIVGWTQTISAIDIAGNITSAGGGSVTCNPISVTLGPLVCGNVLGTVADWPPLDGTLASSAVIDTLLKTITVIDNSNATAGTVSTFYSYDVVPEPGTAMLASLGLAGLAVIRRRQRL